MIIPSKVFDAIADDDLDIFKRLVTFSKLNNSASTVIFNALVEDNALRIADYAFNISHKGFNPISDSLPPDMYPLLITATFKGHLGIVKILHKAGYPLDIQSCHAHEISSEYTHYEILWYLLDHSPLNIAFHRNEIFSVLQNVICNDHDYILSKLITKGFSTTMALEVAVSLQSIKCLNWLADSQSQLPVTDELDNYLSALNKPIEEYLPKWVDDGRNLAQLPKLYSLYFEEYAQTPLSILPKISAQQRPIFIKQMQNNQLT